MTREILTLRGSEDDARIYDGFSGTGGSLRGVSIDRFDRSGTEIGGFGSVFGFSFIWSFGGVGRDRKLAFLGGVGGPLTSSFGSTAFGFGAGFAQGSLPVARAPVRL